MRYFDESIHGMVTVLANECLNGIINTMNERESHLHQHLVRRAGFNANPVIKHFC